MTHQQRSLPGEASAEGAPLSPPELESGTAHLDALLEYSVDAIVMLDSHGTILEWSPAAERMFGIPRRRAIGNSVLDLQRELSIEPLDGPGGDVASALDLRQLIKKGVSVVGGHMSEAQIRLADGTVRVVQANVFPVRRAGTRVIGSIVRDITESRAALEAAQQSERFVATLVSDLRAVAYRRADDRLWTMGYLSEWCGELTGYNSVELVGNRVVAYADLVHPDDRGLALDSVRKALDTGGQYELEYRITTREGDEKWVWDRGKATRGEGGAVVLEGFLADFSEEKRARLAQAAMYAIAQAALTSVELEELSRSIHQIVRTLMPAPNLRIALYDPASEMVSFPYFSDERRARPRPRRGGRGTTEYVLHSDESLLADPNLLESLKASGAISTTSIMPASYLGVPLPGPSGSPVGVLAVQSYDPSVVYTQRERTMLDFVASQIGLALLTRQAEKAIREDRDFAQRLLGTAQALVVVLDLEGRVTTYNAYAESCTGYPAELAAGRDWFDTFMPERDRDEARAVFRAAVRRGVINGHINHVCGMDGSERLIDWHGTRLVDANGRQTGFLATGHDITEHRRLEEQLIQTQKIDTIGRMAGGIAHDFNNILTAITGHTQFALDDLPLSDQARDDLVQALKAAGRASELTRRLLAFSGHRAVEPQLVDVGELMSDTERMLRRLIGENVEFFSDRSQEPCVVRADPVHIEQVLVNLAVNARDAMPEGGRLAAGCRPVTVQAGSGPPVDDLPPGEYVLLTVADSGIGMTEAVAARIFEPFYTTKGENGGTGLGLVTVYAIVNRYQGAIKFRTKVGEGTTFEVYLPRVERSPDRLPDKDGSHLMPTGNETVLVVEDEAIVRSVEARLLSSLGYSVLQAENADVALDLVRRHRGSIDLLVTDVIMPGMSGERLAHTLRQTLPGLSVLYVSGYTGDAMPQGGGLEDGPDFLPKPFTVEALARKVREVLDSRG